MERRTLLFTAATLLAAIGLLFLFSQSPSPGRLSGEPEWEPAPDTRDHPVAQAREPEPLKRQFPIVDRQGTGPNATEGRRDEGSSRFALHLRFLEQGTRVPLPELSVLLVPAGTPPGAAAPGADQRGTTGPSGAAFFGDLGARGPWDLYVIPFQPEARALGLAESVRVGSAMATLWSGAPRPIATEIGVPLGAQAVLRCPLPREMEAADVLFELWVDPSPLLPNAQGVRAFARGQRGPGGEVIGRFHSLDLGSKAPRMTVDVVTVDGLFGTRLERSGRAVAGTIIELPGPLEPRGVVMARIEVADPRGEPVTLDVLRQASAAVGIKELNPVEGSDESAVSRSVLVGRRVPVSADLLGFHGLPLAPVEIGAVSGQSPTGPTREMGVSTAPKYEAATICRVQPVHSKPGDKEPPPTTVRVRRVR